MPDKGLLIGVLRHMIKSSLFLRIFFCAFFLLLLIGCGKEDVTLSQSQDAHLAPPALLREARFEEVSATAASSSESARFLALTYFLTLENESTELEASWKALQAHCLSIACDLMASSFTQGDERSTLPKGFLHFRILPNQLVSLLTVTQKHGRIMAQSVQSEDKTAQVIDTEAQLKNKTELRDRLRALLQNRTGKLSDVLEVETALSERQADIDALVTLRKQLAKETEKNEIRIEFVSKIHFIDGSKTSPLMRAFDRMLTVFLESVATLLLFVSAALPWLLLLVPILWSLRRFRQKRVAAKAQKGC